MGGEGDKEKESDGEREEGEGSVEGEDGEDEGRGGGSGSGVSVKEGGESVVMCELELQGVLQLALWEIRACQELSAGPTFLVSVPSLKLHKYFLMQCMCIIILM